MGQPEDDARSRFFEQLLTQRMPTAGPATTASSLRDNTKTSPTGAPTTTPPPIPYAAEAIDQLPTAHLATHPPATPFAPSAAPVEISQLPTAHLATHPPVTPVPVAPVAFRKRLSRQRRSIMIVAFSAILVVVVMLPVLYVISSSDAARRGRAITQTQVGNHPPGWQPQDWAAAAKQQAEVAYVNQLIAHMSLDQEIGQMIMLGFLETQMSSSLAYTIKQYHLGGVILYAWNITGADQTKQLTAQIQSEGDLPLLVATDQEGGSVNRLAAVDGPLPSASDISATNDPNYARQRGAADAQQLAALGINVNLAPVVDVENTDLGDLNGRTFGSTPDQVTKMAGAYLDGLQSTGQVVGTLKHFPGLGDVPADPHQTLYTLNRSETDLESIDWAPYKSLIATGSVQMVMSTHVVISAVDPTLPASLSKPVLTGILRDQLGYQGVIITDGIYMGALINNFSFDQIIVDAVEAGNDIICSTYSIASTAETVHALENAVQTGQITKERIDESVRRILLLKLHYGVLTMSVGQPAA